LNGQKDKEVST